MLVSKAKVADENVITLSRKNETKYTVGIECDGSEVIFNYDNYSKAVDVYLDIIKSVGGAL